MSLRKFSFEVIAQQNAWFADRGITRHSVLAIAFALNVIMLPSGPTLANVLQTLLRLALRALRLLLASAFTKLQQLQLSIPNSRHV